MSTNINKAPITIPVNRILNGNCIDLMSQLPRGSMDFILTDPPYLVNYRDRSHRSILNDNNASWLKPSFAEAYRVLKPNAFMVTFYSWCHTALKSRNFTPLLSIFVRHLTADSLHLNTGIMH